MSRPPTEKERLGVLKVLAAAPTPEEKRMVMEDIFWGLMSSSEFLFNH